MGKRKADCTPEEWERISEKRREYKRQYREANKEKISERNRQYREENKDHHRQWLESNREKIAERKRQYYQANRDRILEQQRQRYLADPKYRDNRKQNSSKQRSDPSKKAKIEQYKRQWYELNRERIAERARQNHLANRERNLERGRRYVRNMPLEVADRILIRRSDPAYKERQRKRDRLRRADPTYAAKRRERYARQKQLKEETKRAELENRSGTESPNSAAAE